MPLIARNVRRGVRAKTRYPFSLVFTEAKGTLVGPMQYSLVRLKSLLRWALSRSVASPRPEPRPASQTSLVLGPAETQRQQQLHLEQQHYAKQRRHKRARVA